MITWIFAAGHFVVDVLLKIFKRKKPVDREVSDDGLPDKPSDDDRSIDERSSDDNFMHESKPGPDRG